MSNIVLQLCLISKRDDNNANKVKTELLCMVYRIGLIMRYGLEERVIY